MSVPDLFRTVAGKAKDLPLHMLQTALSGVGQALLLGDRVRSRLKRLAGNDEELEETTRPTAADQLAETDKPAEDKPARREPVIFAPAKPKPKPAESEPEPVKAETAEAETEPAAVKAETVKPEPAKAETVKPEPVKAESAAETEPAAVATAEPAATESNGAKARPEPVIFAPAKPKPAETEPEPAAEIAAPPAVKVEVAEVEVAKPETADAAAVEVVKTRPAKPRTAKPKAATAAKSTTSRSTKAAKAADEPESGTGTADAVEAGVAAVPAEPLPGYAELTVASLRARMRGKSAEQIRDLIAYEKATSARPEVVRMFENRLTKLEAGQ
ncbi:hypothetical protein [Planobispora takensis]|uniref:Uncharacterized protein n=1 Tax=Planobispora takensis TaxID=1367882 RepID=A0A8J3WQY6_9ACTN|nr:hypothetical protein [Planobispora takensis]GIH98988.1 hypothetical protein Pta02_09970 [Planobispora takensis]